MVSCVIQPQLGIGEKKGGEDGLVYNGVVALYTSDRRYANAFMEYGIQSGKEQITVKIFTNEESLDYAVKHEHFELLIIDSSCLNDHVLSYDCKVAVLSHERYVKQTDYPVIFIYQKADLVFRQIYDVLSEKTAEEYISCAASTDKPEIIGIFSPCYPLEREEFSREAARILGERKKLLFINLADFTESDYSDEDGISELLLFLQQQGKMLTYKLSALMKQTDGYYSLPGVKHCQDLYSIEEDDINRLMNQLEHIDNIKTVMIDIGLPMEKSYSIVKHCTRVYVPVNLDRSVKKHEHFLHDMSIDARTDFMERMQIVELPVWWSERREMRNNWTKTVVRA